jgi:low temperature requirement protein LtrA
VVTAILGFVIAATIWWVYFDRWRSMPAGGLAAGWVWAQGHLLVFAGIASASVGIDFLVEAAASGRTPVLVDRLALAAGLASYLVAMGLIRAATRRPDWVVVMRVGVAGALLVSALASAGISPVAFTAASTTLLVVEALVELWRAPAFDSERARFTMPHELRRARGEENTPPGV